MKTRTIVVVAALAVLTAVAYFIAGYGAYFEAQAACLRASEGRPAGQSLSHLHDTARKHGAPVVQSGEWVTAVFPSPIGSGFACALRIRDGKLVEFHVGAAGDVAQKK